tara:strand:+ start:1231 stop:1443 length:213 start_codon:yes stop_codon:yes gene_type:complete
MRIKETLLKELYSTQGQNYSSSGSLGLEDKENMADYNRLRRDKQDEKLKDMKSKGFVTDDIWVLTMGRKI